MFRIRHGILRGKRIDDLSGSNFIFVEKVKQRVKKRIYNR